MMPGFTFYGFPQAGRSEQVVGVAPVEPAMGCQIDRVDVADAVRGVALRHVPRPEKCFAASPADDPVGVGSQIEAGFAGLVTVVQVRLCVACTASTRDA